MVTPALFIADAAHAIPMERHAESRFVGAALEVLVALDGIERPNGTVDQSYRLLVDNLAKNVASFVGVDDRALRRVWTTTSVPRLRVLMSAIAELGTPYREFAAEPGVALDCSGLVQHAWRAAGVSLPRGSTSQYASGRRVALANAQPGDLVWRPGHISLYLGAHGAILQTPYRGRQVELHIMNSKIRSWVRYSNPLA